LFNVAFTSGDNVPDSGNCRDSTCGCTCTTSMAASSTTAGAWGALTAVGDCLPPVSTHTAPAATAARTSAQSQRRRAGGWVALAASTAGGGAASCGRNASLRTADRLVLVIGVLWPCLGSRQRYNTAASPGVARGQLHLEYRTQQRRERLQS